MNIDRDRMEWHKLREFEVVQGTGWTKMEFYWDTEGFPIMETNLGTERNPFPSYRLTPKQVQQLSRVPGNIRAVKNGQFEPISQVEDESNRPFYEQQKRRLSKNPRNMRRNLMR